MEEIKITKTYIEGLEPYLHEVTKTSKNAPWEVIVAVAGLLGYLQVLQDKIKEQ